MKKFILLAALFMATFSVSAQIADGSIAPDFTVTDIYGAEYNLYEILDQGKTVILDISITGSLQSWTYRQSGELKDLWETYGPAGTDELFILFVEGDVSTTMDDLEGNTDESQGNWINGTPYPIIDNADIANTYQVAYYPTIFMICPDKRVTVRGQETTEELYNASTNCTFGMHNVAFRAYSGDRDISCGEEETITPEITIQNRGTTNLTSCNIELQVDGSTIEIIEWIGELAPIETEVVTFSNVLVSSSAELTFLASVPNGEMDASIGNNKLTTIVGSQRAKLDVTFDIITDFWPEETTWQLKNANGDVLYSNEDEGILDCDKSYTQTYNLEPGQCYTFSIQDSNGDGLQNGLIGSGTHNCNTTNGQNNYANGAINLRSSAGVLLDEIEYGEGIDVELITLNLNSTEELALEGLKLFPNPAMDNVNLSFEMEKSKDLEITLYNMFGQMVKSINAQIYNTGTHVVEINTTNVTNGMYFVNISDGNAVATRKLIITK